MRIVKLTSETTKNILENMLKRSPSQYGEYEKRVQDIIANVKEKKDEAVFAYTRQFDKADINASNIRVTEEEIQEAYEIVTELGKHGLKVVQECAETLNKELFK